MRAVQKGFTLIELVVVIVVLGILAATALPKFVDLSGEAKTAAVKGVAGELGSAMALNYAKCAANSFNFSVTGCSQVTACSTALALTQAGSVSGYSVTGTPGTTRGDSGSCTVMMDSPDSAYSATFTGIRTN